MLSVKDTYDQLERSNADVTAALGTCGSILLVLIDRKLITEKDARDVLTDVTTSVSTSRASFSVINLRSMSTRRIEPQVPRAAVTSALDRSSPSWVGSFTDSILLPLRPALIRIHEIGCQFRALGTFRARETRRLTAAACRSRPPFLGALFCR